ncbi:MAG: gliding motility-associated C-terminal domain-containing protein [Bacteroidia bacterium]|nr:gliding motility-associated C-terminal domain-containing protein [Bacteroidia bacterium]
MMEVHGMHYGKILMRKFILIIYIFLSNEVFSQLFINNGAKVINNNIIAINNFDLENNGDISNNGEIIIKGSFINSGLFKSNNITKSSINLTADWTNNASFLAGKSVVIFNGANQKIGGVSSTRFNVLELKGVTGNSKTMFSYVNIADSLYLNNTELATNGNELKISNGTIPIQRISGYISTLNKGIVKIYFPTLLSNFYEIPLGYGNSTNQYKPFYLIKPASDSFAVTLFGNSPLNESMNPLFLQDSLCSINQNYYYSLQTYGSALFYGITKSVTENDFSKLASWDGTKWQKITLSGKTPLLLFNNISLNSQPNQSFENIAQAQEKPFVKLGSDFYVDIGKSAQIYTNGFFPNGSSILWSPSVDLSCNDCINPKFTMGTPGEIIIKVSNGMGCEAIDTINILLKRNYLNLIPSSFSPNGDLLNDIFGPELLPGDKLEIMEIYNRWGQEIYKGEKFWDGKYLNELVMQGVYIYKMVIISSENNSKKRHILKGEFTLLR